MKDTRDRSPTGLPSSSPEAPSSRQPDRLLRVLPSIEVRTMAHPERTLVGMNLCGGPPRQSINLGEILEIIAIGGEDYFLVDSRHWTFGSRRLIPTWAVVAIDLVDEECRTALPLDIIRRSPDFDPFRLSDPRYHRILRNVFGESD